MLTTSFIDIAKAAGAALCGLLLLKLSSILYVYIKKRTKKTGTFWDDAVFEIFKRGTQLIIVAIVFYYLINILDHDTVTTSLEIVLIFLGAYLSVKVIDFLLQTFQKSVVKESKTRLDDLVFPMLMKASKVSIYVCAGLISLDHLGYDITALLAGLGVAGIAVSLAAKDSISNAIAGIFLMLDRPFLPGDRIELWDSPPHQATWGDVVEIGLRSTEIRTTDNITIIIPNGQLMKRDIINYTRHSPTIRIRIPVGVSYQCNLKTVKEVLCGAIKGMDGICDNPGPQVVVKEFGDSSINVELRVWIKNAKNRRGIQDEINSKIKMEFEESSIEMPYPKQDITVKGDIQYRLKDRGTG
jgi:small-conductance mechanosensitive channel